MDITPPTFFPFYSFTLLLFKAIVQHEVLNFLFYFPFLLPLYFFFSFFTFLLFNCPAILRKNHYLCKETLRFLPFYLSNANEKTFFTYLCNSMLLHYGHGPTNL